MNKGKFYERIVLATRVDLMVADADGNRERVLTRWALDPQPGNHGRQRFGGAVGAPVWSPDGTHIAVALGTLRHPNKHALHNTALHVIDVAGGAQRQITPWVIGAENPSWSRDANHIAFNSEGGHSPNLYVVDPDGRHRNSYCAGTPSRVVSVGSTRRSGRPMESRSRSRPRRTRAIRSACTGVRGTRIVRRSISMRSARMVRTCAGLRRPRSSSLTPRGDRRSRATPRGVEGAHGFATATPSLASPQGVGPLRGASHGHRGRHDHEAPARGRTGGRGRGGRACASDGSRHRARHERPDRFPRYLGPTGRRARSSWPRPTAVASASSRRRRPTPATTTRTSLRTGASSRSSAAGARVIYTVRTDGTGTRLCRWGLGLRFRPSAPTRRSRRPLPDCVHPHVLGHLRPNRPPDHVANLH